MILKVNEANKVAVVAAFLRVGAHAVFEVARELGPDVLKKIEDFCRERNISVQVVAPDGTRILIYTGAGAAVGAAVGYALAGPVGAIGGAGLGAVEGYSLSHIRIVWQPEGDLIRITT